MDNKYLVYTRKWRPQSFEEVLGQDQVVVPLKSALANNRLMHAYLFSGPRGIGKTTTARLFAKALNCQSAERPVAEPCNACSSCLEITQGSSLDVIEIDGASNSGVEDIRQLREKVGFGAAKSRYKVYIIDEVHMLSKEAFNALLKTLEEPPAHVIFVFATTDPQNVPQTILSRCQHFRFKRASVETAVDSLRYILEKEKIKCGDEPLFMIARAADGALRDAQRILDQAVTFSKGRELTTAVVAEMLGEIESDLLYGAIEAMVSGDLKKVLTIAEKIFDAGYDLKHFLKSAAEALRNMIIVRYIDSKKSVTAGEEEYARLKRLSASVDEQRNIYMLQRAIEAEKAVIKSSIPSIIVEAFMLEASGAAAAAEPAPAPPKSVPSVSTSIPEEKPEEEKHQAGPVVYEIEEKEEAVEVTKELLERKWEEIIEKAASLKAEEEVLEAMRAARVVDYSDGNVTLIGDNLFYTNMIRKRLDAIADILFKEYKQPLRANVFEKKEFEKRREVHKAVTEEDLKNLDPVKKISSIFGEVKEVRVVENPKENK